MLRHLLIGKRFVTTRDEESAVGNSDDVFLAEEESRSFQEQVAFVKTFRNSAISAKRNGSYVGVPGDLCRRSLYSSTGWQPQASTAAASTQL